MKSDYFYQSEEFQAFFKCSSRSLVLKANPPHFTILAVSDTYLSLIHKERSHVLNKNLFEVFPGSAGDPLEKDSVFSSFMRAIANKKTDKLPIFKYEIYNKETDCHETEYWTNDNEPLFDEEGNVSQLINTTTNITELVRSKQTYEQMHTHNEALQIEKSLVENILRDNQQRLQAILNTIAEGVCIVNAGGRLVYANRVAQEILNLNEAEIKNGTDYHSIWHNQEADGFAMVAKEHPLSITMTSGLPVYNQEVSARRRNGEVFYVSVNTAPLHDQQGSITGGICTFVDVTNQRKLRDNNENFIHVASHELKTPVTAIKGYADILEEIFTATGDDFNAKSISMLNGQVDRLIKLVSNLLDMTNICDGQLVLKPERFRIDKVINEQIELAQKTTQKHTLIFDSCPFVIHADKERITQVFTNLLSNAIRYSPDGGKIFITCEEMNKEVKIGVKDHGLGIVDGLQGKVFDRFFRIEQGLGMTYPGMGLGLYITAEIIYRHGGKIWLESEPKKGSIFYFTLPLHIE